MSDLLKKCEEYYGTRDFYEVLKINRSATKKEIKKAYHRLSLLVHPDRVEENKKTEATEKFKVLGKIHSILQDSDKRAVYDDVGEFDEESDATFNWLDYWRSMFKKISIKDIQNYEKEYIGSDSEVQDVKRAYVSGKGSMDHILELVPFSNCDNESRIIEIVRKLVDDGDVEEYDCFFNEPQKKKNKRRLKFESEKREYEESKITDQDLEREIQLNHAKREKAFGDMISKLESKYNNKNSKRKRVTDTIYTPPTKKRTTKSKK